MDEKSPAGGARFKAAARLIRGISISRGPEPDGVYENGVYSYGIIAGALKDQALARTISEAAGIPHEKVLPAAQRIIELLLWNRQDNPFTSLGLSPFATIEEIHSRWQSLIAIYHPDRHGGDPRSEEIAKKLNEAYRRACQIKSSPRKARHAIIPAATATRDRPESSAGGSKTKIREKLVTRAIALAAAALLLLFSLLLLIGGRGKAPSLTLGEKQVLRARQGVLNPGP